MYTKFTHTILALCLCLVSTAMGAQSRKSPIPFRFATQAEAQMRITDIDAYTGGWNQFDINVRMQSDKGRKSQLLAKAMNATRNWSNTDRTRVTASFNRLTGQADKLKLAFDYPQEIILIKTTMEEEGNMPAYTRNNWIAIGQETLNSASDAELDHILAHELFHILTRHNQAFKKAAYASIGFTVLDKEIIFPTDFMQQRISSPDISNYDSYASFTINGREQICTMAAYTDRPYSGGTLDTYRHTALIPLDSHFIPLQENGKTVVYSTDDASDFNTRVGQNTTLRFHPEEILAEHFAILLAPVGKTAPDHSLIDTLCSNISNLK